MRNLFYSRLGCSNCGVLSALLLPLLLGQPANAQTAPQAAASTPQATDKNKLPWRSCYEIARDQMIGGNSRAALQELERLARDASTDSERLLAQEMAQVCRAQLAREPAPDPRAFERATRDEMNLLYGHAFLYGLGTGTWFLLQTRPGSVIGAMLPFAGFTIASIGAVTVADHYRPFPRGVPHALATGIYVGLAEGIWLVGAQHARADHFQQRSGQASHWRSATVSSVLWGTTTLGAVSAGLIASQLRSTPGQAAFVGSTSLWSGLLGLMAGSAFFHGDRQRENAFWLSGAALNAGLIGSALWVSTPSPSVEHVRFVDLGGLAGGLVALGAYQLAAQGNADERWRVSISGAGILAGLGVAGLLTAGMPAENNKPAAPSFIARIQPLAVPLPGGLQLGVMGDL